MDYNELIDELKDEVGSGSLTNNEIIQVLRSDEAEADGYKAVVDWHYNAKTMTIELAPDTSDSSEEIRDKKLLNEQYQRAYCYYTCTLIIIVK